SAAARSFSFAARISGVCASIAAAAASSAAFFVVVAAVINTRAAAFVRAPSASSFVISFTCFSRFLFPDKKCADLLAVERLIDRLGRSPVHHDHVYARSSRNGGGVQLRHHAAR